MSAVAATLGAGFLNAAGSVYSNAVNSAAQIAINNKNAAVQYAINADQIEAARMNNETAINLANTAHQREVQDLRDANLNPILSAHGNGSAVPALDTPGLEAPQAVAPSFENPLSGLASSLASAVQVNDAHNLNDERIKALEADLTSRGFGDAISAEDKKTLQHLYAKQASQAINTSIAQNQASEEKAILENVKAQLEQVAFCQTLGVRPSNWHTSGTGRLKFNPPANKENYSLLLEGVLSDLKMRANRNMREGINSATSISNAASSLGSAVKGWIPKSWFK